MDTKKTHIQRVNVGFAMHCSNLSTRAAGVVCGNQFATLVGRHNIGRSGTGPQSGRHVGAGRCSPRHGAGACTQCASKWRRC